MMPAVTAEHDSETSSDYSIVYYGYDREPYGWRQVDIYAMESRDLDYILCLYGNAV